MRDSSTPIPLKQHWSPTRQDPGFWETMRGVSRPRGLIGSRVLLRENSSAKLAAKLNATVGFYFFQALCTITLKTSLENWPF
mgnify:CR=1 FL=1|jgi:hypothetical protein